MFCFDTLIKGGESGKRVGGGSVSGGAFPCGPQFFLCVPLSSDRNEVADVDLEGLCFVVREI